MYATSRGLGCASVRFGLVYGRGPVMKTDYRFITAPNKFCLQAARGETLVVNESGLAPQGLIHVEDAAAALSRRAGCWAGEYLRANAVTEAATMRR